MAPEVLTFRSICRGRLLYAAPAWVLERTPEHIVTAIVPGAETVQLVGPRPEHLVRLAQGTARIALAAWRTNRVVWLTRFGAAHALGHFWRDTTNEFLGYYVNLQAPLRPSAYGYDSCDQVLDIVIRPDGTWRWKDESEFEEAPFGNLFARGGCRDPRRG